MKGRKPKPTSVKKRAGNPGKRPLNQHEARVPRAFPDCPKHLVGVARSYWKERGQKAYDAGLLSDQDGGMLALLCQVHARRLKAEAQLTKHGMVALTIHGTFKQSPWFVIVRDLTEQEKKLEVEFGGSPSSRSRVSAAETEQMSLAELLFTKTKAES